MTDEQEKFRWVLKFSSFWLPLTKFLDKFKDKPILKNFGYGSIAVVEKLDFSDEGKDNS